MPANVHAVGAGARGRIIALSLAVMILILLSTTALAAQTITRVQAVNLQDKVQIGVTATKPLSFTVKQHAKGSYIAFDIKGYYQPVRPGKLRVAGGNIYSVKYGRFRSNPPITRIAIATKGKVAYHSSFQDDGKKLLIDVWKTAKPVAAKPASVVKPAPKATAVVPANPVPAAQSSPTASAQAAPSAIVKTAVLGVAEPVSDEPAEVAEPAPAPAPAATPKPVVVAAVPETAGASPARITRRAGETISSTFDTAKSISLDFHMADITDVLKALAIQSGTNIVTGSDVKGQVTVTLNKVSLEDALDYVVKPSGFRYAKADDGTYLVGANVGAAVGESGGIVTEAVTLRLATPELGLKEIIADVAPGVKVGYLAPAKSTEAAGSAGPPTRSLGTALLTGPARDVAVAKDALMKLEESLCQASNGAVVETYRVKYGDAADLTKLLNQVVPAVTVSWGPMQGFEIAGKEVVKVGLAGAATGDFTIKKQPLMLILTGEEAVVKQALQLLEQVDIKQGQVLIEAKVTDVSVDDAKDLGVKWDWSSFAYSQNSPSVDVLQIPSVTTKGFTRMPLSFEALFDAKVLQDKVKILAEPTLAVLESKPASFFVGDELRYIISKEVTPTGTNILTETATVGVQLRVLAQVNDGTDITLNIHPEVSVINDFLDLGGGIVLPQIGRRFADSTIRVKDGQTIAIGGLIRDDEIKNFRKVPLLGDIPFFGQLFRHRSITKERSEVVIFITAKIIKD